MYGETSGIVIWCDDWRTGSKESTSRNERQRRASHGDEIQRSPTSAATRPTQTLRSYPYQTLPDTERLYRELPGECTLVALALSSVRVV